MNVPNDRFALKQVKTQRNSHEEGHRWVAFTSIIEGKGYDARLDGQ